MRTSLRRFRPSWPGLRPALGLGLAGVATALGQAPWGWWPVSMAGLAVVLFLTARARDGREGFMRAFIAGVAGFGVAMVWIVEPFLVEPERHAWMAPFALVLMVAGMALFWGAAGAFAAWAVHRPVARIWALALAMLALEALRGHLLTGFPWAMLGHVWIDTPVAQLAVLGGALGLSALSLSMAAALATAGVRWVAGRRGRAVLVAAITVASLASAWAWGAARLASPAEAPDARPASPALRLRLVQPNADQALKWDWQHAETFYWRHIDLTAAPAADGRAPELVIWSETAVPFFLDNPGNGLVYAAEAAGGAPVIMGIQRHEADPDGARRFYNSLAVIDATGEPVAVYDKHHLVPFGEYVPLLGRYADRPGLGWAAGLAARALVGYTAGPGPVVLDLGAAGRVLPLICYEAIFPRNLTHANRPDWLLQITNDAWFGQRIGPFQHLAQARLRAIEQGLPLVRAANTGISAVIDAQGRVTAALGMDRVGALDADLPAARAPTPYARTGDLPWYLVLAAGMLALGFGRFYRHRAKPIDGAARTG